MHTSQGRKRVPGSLQLVGNDTESLAARKGAPSQGTFKVLFLDVDGVLNYDCGEPIPIIEHRCLDLAPSYLCPVRLARLARVVHATGARVVLSSFWRGPDELREYLQGVLALWGVRIHACTPIFATYRQYMRGDEVQEWIDGQNGRVARYVILDDGNDFTPEQQPNLVLTDVMDGLTEADAARAIEILGEVDRG